MHEPNERSGDESGGEYRLKTWAEVEAQLPQHVRDKIDAKFKVTMARLRLGDIREAVGKTQVEIASELRLGQGSVSKIERAADMYLSTLRRYIEALGGELLVSARFPEGTDIAIESLSSARGVARRKSAARSAPKPAARASLARSGAAVAAAKKSGSARTPKRAAGKPSRAKPAADKPAVEKPALKQNASRAAKAARRSVSSNSSARSGRSKSGATSRGATR
jgi:transcriptional regulator with XRE-family HTH domain